MSSPKPNALFILHRSGTYSISIHDLSKTKTVHISKNNHHVTIMVMAPVNVPIWKKQSCFDTLKNNVYNLAKGDHKMADIINMIMEEMPSSSNSSI